MDSLFRPAMMFLVSLRITFKSKFADVNRFIDGGLRDTAQLAPCKRLKSSDQNAVDDQFISLSAMFFPRQSDLALNPRFLFS